MRGRDAAGNAHVMCTGVDLSPALAAQGFDPAATIDEIESACNKAGGVAPVPDGPRQQLESVGKILNIGWISRGAEKEASIICPRSSTCPPWLKTSPMMATCWLAKVMRPLFA